MAARRWARTTHAGAILATGYMSVVAVLYLTVPHVMVLPFAAEMEPAEWAKIAPIIPLLLLFVALYSLADGANIIYAFRSAQWANLNAQLGDKRKSF